MFKNIKNETLIITNNSYKKKILLEMSKDEKLYPITFMTLKEFINNYYYSYDEKTIYYLMKKYGYKYDVCKVYLDAMIYLEKKEYPFKKLIFLRELKHELDSNNLLIYNSLFNNFLRNKDIILYNEFPEKKVLRDLESLRCKFINDKEIDKSVKVYEFDDINLEVQYVFWNISNLLENGVNYNNIKILNLKEEYYNIVERMSYLYNIPININNTKYIETKIVQEFLMLLKENSLKDSLKKIEDKYLKDQDKKSLVIYNRILNTCNKLLFVKENNIFIEMFSALMNQNIVINNGIDLINMGDCVNDDDYVFLMGFEQKYIPKIHKNEKYITDNMKKYISMYTTEEKNILEYKYSKAYFLNIKNLIITYKKNSESGVCYPSNLLEEDCFIKEIDCINHKKYYSSRELKLILGKSLDNLRKLGEKDKNLELLYNNVSIDYNSYDNSYKKIDSSKFLSTLKMPITLSYTSMNDYYKCAFRYYLNYILKLNKYDDSIQIFIGNLFHYILSICFNDNFNFEKEYYDYVKRRELTEKEKFFVDNLKQELEYIINIIKDQNLLSELRSYLYEENINVPISDNIIFNGKIDKIMYKNESEKTYVAVLDYKTGNVDISLKYKEYGIGLQLPTYLYLIKKSNLFKNILFSGFFLQKIINKEIEIKKGKNYRDLKKETLKFIGYSNSDIEILERLDKSYENSEMIKGMKISSSGFYHYSNIMSNDEIDNLIKLVEKKIKFAAEKIMNAEFSINPKIIDKDNIGCKNCKYKDICFVKEDDKIYINTKENE